MTEIEKNSLVCTSLGSMIRSDTENVAGSVLVFLVVIDVGIVLLEWVSVSFMDTSALLTTLQPDMSTANTRRSTDRKSFSLIVILIVVLYFR
jgi:hypothetical protein